MIDAGRNGFCLPSSIEVLVDTEKFQQHTTRQALSGAVDYLVVHPGKALYTGAALRGVQRERIRSAGTPCPLANVARGSADLVRKAELPTKERSMIGLDDVYGLGVGGCALRV